MESTIAGQLRDSSYKVIPNMYPNLSSVKETFDDSWKTLHFGTGEASITVFADSTIEEGVKTTVTSENHGLREGDTVYIAGTTNYDGLHQVSNVVDANTYDIDTAFEADDGTGTGKKAVEVNSMTVYATEPVLIRIGGATGDEIEVPSGVVVVLATTFSQFEVKEAAGNGGGVFYGFGGY